jgi:hypothetical protein
MGNNYLLGHEYIDKGSVSNENDQFLRWMNIKNSGMRNMSGIRPLTYITRFFNVPAYLILVTSETSSRKVNHGMMLLISH